MSDILLQIGQKSTAGKFLTSLGIPVPPQLKRSRLPWSELPFKDMVCIVGGWRGEVHEAIARAILPAGGTVFAADESISHYASIGEAYSRPVSKPPSEGKSLKPHALIFDATGIDDPDTLVEMHEFFQPRIRSLAASGRIIVLGRTVADCREPSQAAAQRALEGFVKSVAKEIGKKGAVANMISVQPGGEQGVVHPLRFLLSDASCYVSGQNLTVTKAVDPVETILDVKPLQGKVALVTGAARGIGAATAAALAKQGATVVCLDRPEDDEPLSATARKIGGIALPQDISAVDAPEVIAAWLLKETGGVDIVVHNAGITRDKTLGNMSREKWEQTVGINCSAVIAVTKGLLETALHDGGRIVCLSSIAGIAGNFGQTNYAASKAGLIGYIQAMAPTLAQRGITINGVAPGFIETRMTAAIPLATREVGRRLNNLSQAGLPQDVAQVITFLSTPGAWGMSGTVTRVCAGNLLGA